MTKGFYQYQVVENEGTELEFVCRSFDLLHEAQTLIDELYEPEDYKEMTITIRRVRRKRNQMERPNIPSGTTVEQECRGTRENGRKRYTYIAKAGNIARRFKSRKAAAVWLNKHCH